MSQITSEDRPLHQEVETLIGAKLALQTELRSAPSSQKQFFVNIIRDLDRELSDKQDEQSQFVAERSFDQFELIVTQFDGRPFTAELDGTVTIEIDHSNDDIRGPP